MTDDTDLTTDTGAESDTGADTEAPMTDQPSTDGDRSSPRLTRRRVVASGAALGAAALAGCADDESDDTPTPDEETPPETDDPDENGDDEPESAAPDLPQVEDPPAATYIPTHFEAMRHLEPVEAGEFEVEPMITYPHAFWNVTGDEAEIAEPSGSDDVHLMAAVRDAETGEVLPAETGTEIEVGLEGESKSPHAPWPMISQEMGFHIGDNVPLGEDGTYEVDIRVAPIDVDKTGSFDGRFEEAATASFTFEYDEDFRREVVSGIHYLDEEHWGEHGSLANHMAGHGDHDHDHHDGDGDDDGHEHHEDEDEDGHEHHDGEEDGHEHHDGEHGHDHDHHGDERWSEGEGHHRFGTYLRDADEGELPPADHLPGHLLGEPVVADALLATTVVDRDSRFVDDDDAYYLLVSPRTPYNRSMLPMMALGYELRRDGETVASGSLRDTLDPDVGYHYGAARDDLRDGDELVVTVETVPNVSRHAGYETAFLDDGSVELEVELP
ncbi:hypothetical protein JCM17823_27580 [Halorubrum gandharaense]